MRKFIVLAAVSAAAFSASAAAAQEASPFAGFYIGGQVSYGQLSTKYDDVNWEYNGGRATETKDDGVMAGAKLGYNVVKGNVLFGLEAETQIGKLESVDVRELEGYYTAGTKATLLGSVRAKLGLTKNNLAVFVSGGYAFSDAKQSFSEEQYDECEGEYYAANGETKADRSGYVLGFGASYAVTKNTAVSLEASRYQFSNSSVSMYDDYNEEMDSVGKLRDRFETLTVSYTVKF